MCETPGFGLCMVDVEERATYTCYEVKVYLHITCVTEVQEKDLLKDVKIGLN